MLVLRLSGILWRCTFISGSTVVGDLGERVRIGLGLGLVEIVEIEFSCYFELVDSTDEGL